MRGLGERAHQRLARAFAAQGPAEWVVGETVSGYDQVRMFLEAQRNISVLAVSQTHQIWVQGRPQPVGLVAALLPDEAWVVLSVGEDRWGVPAGRLDLAAVAGRGGKGVGKLGAHATQPLRSERASSRVSGPTTSTLGEVGRGRGRSFQIEEGYEQAKGHVGLVKSEVRTWRAWHRNVTLARLSSAALMVMQGQAGAQKNQVESWVRGLS